jgi:hypothetical protein
MWFHSVLDYLKSGPSQARAGRGRRVAPRKRPAICKLNLEALEDRSVPSSSPALNFAVGLDSPPALVNHAHVAGHGAEGEQVSFKGRLEGLDLTTAVNPPFVSVKVTATGNATHLGKFTYTELATVDTRTRIGTGTFLFTAANGDTVFGTISGQARLTAPNVLTIEENAIITGGTGRFDGATGGFTVTRLKDTVTGVTTGSFTGTILRPEHRGHQGGDN